MSFWIGFGLGIVAGVIGQTVLWLFLYALMWAQATGWQFTWRGFVRGAPHKKAPPRLRSTTGQ